MNHENPLNDQNFTRNFLFLKFSEDRKKRSKNDNLNVLPLMRSD